MKFKGMPNTHGGVMESVPGSYREEAMRSLGLHTNDLLGLRDYASRCHAAAIEKGWWENYDRNFGELIALIHTELSEMFEEYRDDKPVLYFQPGDGDRPGKPEGILAELADVLIRCFDLAQHIYNSTDTSDSSTVLPNIEQAVAIKMAYNKTRPHRHGGKKA